MKWIKVQVPDDFEGSGIINMGFLPNGQECMGAIWEPKYTNVLDRGFVGLIDFMGDDNTIVQAARVSYGKGTKKKNSDKGLIRYLKRHHHSSPIEMCEFMYHVKAPIFVLRQWIRHRMSSTNEYSARYSEMEDEFYFPEIEHIKPQSTNNKQGRAGEIDANNAKAVLTALEENYETAFTTYQYLLNNNTEQTPGLPDAINLRRTFVEQAAMSAITQLRDKHGSETVTDAVIDAKLKEYYQANELYVTDEFYPGLARELARICLPVATYSQMYWKIDLHNLMHFMRLRSDSHAQYEIRVYSDAMMDLIEPIVPWAIEAFKDYDLHAMNFSRMEVNVLRTLLANTSKDNVESLLQEQGLSGREMREFIEKLM